MCAGNHETSAPISRFMAKAGLIGLAQLLAHEQTETVSFGVRGEERLEQMPCLFLADTRAVIADRDPGQSGF